MTEVCAVLNEGTPEWLETKRKAYVAARLDWMTAVIETQKGCKHENFVEARSTDSTRERLCLDCWMRETGRGSWTFMLWTVNPTLPVMYPPEVTLAWLRQHWQGYYFNNDTEGISAIRKALLNEKGAQASLVRAYAEANYLLDSTRY